MGHGSCRENRGSLVEYSKCLLPKIIFYLPSFSWNLVCVNDLELRPPMCEVAKLDEEALIAMGNSMFFFPSIWETWIGRFFPFG